MNAASRCLSLAAAFFLCSLSSVLSAPLAMGQANLQGQWQTLTTLAPITPIHIALIHNGKDPVASDSGNDKTEPIFQAGVLPPSTDTMTTHPVTCHLLCTDLI